MVDRLRSARPVIHTVAIANMPQGELASDGERQCNLLGCLREVVMQSIVENGIMSGPHH